MLTTLFTIELLQTTRSYFNYETKTKVDLITYEKDNNYPVITIVSRQFVDRWARQILFDLREVKGLDTSWRYEEEVLQADFHQALYELGSDTNCTMVEFIISYRYYYEVTDDSGS